MALAIEGGVMRSGLPVGGYGGSPENARQGWFRRLAIKTAEICGKPVTFAGAVLIVIVWGVSGPIFHFSDTWQLVINTGTTIVTFLMVFLISGDPEPRYGGDLVEARRTHHRHQEGARPGRRSRGPER